MSNETDLRRYLHKYERISPKKAETPNLSMLSSERSFIPSTPGPSYLTPPSSPLPQPSPFLSPSSQQIFTPKQQTSFLSTPLSGQIRLRGSPAPKQVQSTPSAATLEEQNAQISFETTKIAPTLKIWKVEKPWPRWILNVRKWLAYEIENLNARITKCNEAMARYGLSNNDCFSVFKNTNELIPFFMKDNPSPELMKVLKERFELENFLDLNPNRRYVINRLKDLGKQTFSLPLSQMMFNGGADYEGMKWNETLPTDVHIVMHLFRTLFDLKASYMQSGPRSFSAKYFLDLSSLPSNLDKKNKLPKNSLVMIQTQKYPPHYFVREGETNYLTESGRENLLQTIVMFLYRISLMYVSGGSVDESIVMVTKYLEIQQQ